MMVLSRFFSLIIFCLYFFSSCVNEKQMSIIDHFPIITEVVSMEMPVDSFLGNPYQIIKVRDKLVIADVIDEKLIHIYDLGKQEIVKQIFSKGSGPNDLLLPIYINTIDTNTISVFQRQSSIYTEYNVSDLLQGNLNPSVRITFPESDNIKKLSNNLFIGNGLFKDGAMGVYYKDGNLFKYWDTYPSFINNLSNPSQKFQIGQQYFTVNSLNNFLITASIFTGHIQFFNINNQLEINKIKEFKTSLSSIEQRIENVKDIKLKSEDIVYYEDITSTDSFFYILYCGNSMNKKETKENNYILQFDFKGEPIQALKTNKRIFKFCVSDDDSELYAIALDEDMSHNIIRFDLPRNIDK